MANSAYKIISNCDIYATLLLIDVRRHIEIEESDLLSWLSERNIPIIPVITKCRQTLWHQNKNLPAWHYNISST